MIRCGIALLLCASPLLAQQRADVAQNEGMEPIGARIARIAKAASPAEVEKTVRELCAFGTRHVLSRTDSASEGTGAARSYLKQRFEQLIERSGGRLRVELQRGVVSVAREGMPKEVEVVNVIATLPGTSDSARVYVIGGHYDSRNSDGADGKRAAPGANDDASGTAVALEACRLLCAETFPSTIVFCAFDGEEQGLVGSKYAATLLRWRGAAWRSEAFVEYEEFEAADDSLDDMDDGATPEAKGTLSPRKLREWVPASAIASPPSPPVAGWLRRLHVGNEVEAFHEGGWWSVRIISRRAASVRLGEEPQFVVEAVGYGIQRTVSAANLRPCAVH
jgi:hypothetical protein